MLQKLSIRNYALIDSLDIEFDKGLNIITGETGAGKSIILGALSLILGQRAESKYFFNQDKKCVIEGSFALADENLKELFEENDLDFANESILRREISIDGKTRSFINDTPVNLSILKQIGEKLIDIHSQHATQEINDTDFQLLIVDSLANHQSLLFNYRSGFKKLKQETNLLKKLVSEADEARNKQDYEQFLFNELEQAKLQDGEQEDLEQELERLTHAETIKRALLTASGLINESEPSALQILKEASLQLQNIEKFDPAINVLYERLRSSIIEIKDITDEVSGIEENTIHSADRLEIVNQRLDLFYTLQQKHRVANNTELLVLQKQLEENLNKLLSSDEHIEKLQKEIDQLNKELHKQAEQLSANRKKAIKMVEEQTSITLKQVGMLNAKLVLEQKSLNELNKDGLDEINLLFTANAGQAPAPVNKVASGGELSRLMLAIKALLAKHTSLPTIIFDEIDTGISGETALKVGEVIADLGQNMQVISITHLPQIAAKGISHYFVHKNEDRGKTTTGIRKLKQEERIGVIAEMLSGKNPGTSAIENARELLA
ncbi:MULTISPECIES: DNA repair protein RecN [unclassified Pedobacter]|uniref:DNA repair protein RecN n=1 Tax=unclassified Pedobacter TaxID=2628915 RepID=UPI0014201849|nr:MULTISPECIES: DNA repair protein RecN [unclassified Pedobacter]NII85201.1 DNA repair protein RecN (Recombination protein N) [Pedobacter sp. SG908]NMN39885.1 DNA repair protein RecN (Recombination protein N) [Pedobacter sp. SG918]